MNSAGFQEFTKHYLSPIERYVSCGMVCADESGFNRLIALRIKGLHCVRLFL